MWQTSAILTAAASHALAWAAFLALAILPSYLSTSGADRTLAEVNGGWVVALLMVPVVLTGAGLAAAIATGWGRSRAEMLIVAFAVLLVLLAGFFYLRPEEGRDRGIDWYYPPAVIALAAAAGFIASRIFARTPGKPTLWVAATGMFLFCGLGIFSVGFLFLPALVALLAAAIFISLSPVAAQ